MNKFFITLLLTTTLLTATQFTKNNILGAWSISSLKANGFTSFGDDFSTKRAESYHLLFNRTGEVKNLTTGKIYNYEIVNGVLKIYKTKIYHNNFIYRDKRHYDLFKIISDYENCSKVIIIKKKLPGYYLKAGYKWCKEADYPLNTTKSNENYSFH